MIVVASIERSLGGLGFISLFFPMILLRYMNLFDWLHVMLFFFLEFWVVLIRLLSTAHIEFGYGINCLLCFLVCAYRVWYLKYCVFRVWNWSEIIEFATLRGYRVWNLRLSSLKHGVHIEFETQLSIEFETYLCLSS